MANTRILRSMLVHEEGESLEFARAVPRAWLIQGRRIALRDAPTRFGRVSFAIRSDVLNGTIAVSITPPERRPVPIRLRLRHPRGLSIRAVTVNGRPHGDFKGEWIDLPAGPGRLEVAASY